MSPAARATGLRPATGAVALALLVALSAGCAADPGVCTADGPLHARPRASAAAPARPAPKPVAFIESFDGALAQARGEGRLLFVDAWAPWCHTCLSMRKEVLDRPELGAYADRVVFAAVDTDRPESAGFVERYPMRAWPTFFVIEPASGAVLAMYGGSTTLEEMTRLLDAGLAARSGAAPGDRTLVEAHDAYAKRDVARAADLYVQASATVGDARRAEALIGAIRALSESGRTEACVDFGQAHADKVPGSSTPVDFAYYWNECVEALPAGAAKDAAAAPVRARIAALAEQPPKGASVDDRADLFGLAAELRAKQGDAAGARALEERRLALLDEAIGAAKTPEEAHVYDYERMGALLALGRGEEAVAMFEGRTKDLPTTYEPYARLASTLIAVGRREAALAPLERAIELSYGPRRLRYMATKSATLLELGRREAAIETLEAEAKAWRALPAAQAEAKRIADVDARLAAAKAPATPEAKKKPKPKP
jgi:thioredoxin-like negative regulator of GroEL